MLSRHHQLAAVKSAFSILRAEQAAMRKHWDGEVEGQLFPVVTRLLKRLRGAEEHASLLERKAAAAEEEQSEWRAASEASNKEMFDLRSQLDVLQTEWRREVHDLGDKLEAQATERASVERRFEEATANEARWRAEYETSAAEAARLGKRAIEAEQGRAHLVSEVKALRLTLAESNENAERKQATFASQIARLEAEVERLQGVCERNDGAAAALEAAREEAEAVARKASAREVAIRDEAQRGLAKELGELRSAHAEEVFKLRAAVKLRGEEEAKAKEEAARARESSAAMSKEVAGLRKRVVDVEAVAGKAERSAEIMRRHSQSLESANGSHALQIEQLREALRQRDEELSRLREETRSFRESHEREEERQRNEDDGLEALERRLIGITQALKEKETEARHLEAIVHRECRERGRLQELLERFETRFGPLE